MERIFYGEVNTLDSGSLPLNTGSWALNWYAVYTKVGEEDNVVKNLGRAQISTLNPKMKKTKIIKNRYQEVVVPLFPCYIFARFDAKNSYRLVRYTRGVKDIVGGNNELWPVSEEIIRLIESNMEEDGTITVEPTIKLGDKVEIVNGPLKGMIGILEKEISDKERVIVLLNAMESQVRLEIQRRCLIGGANVNK